MLQIFFGSKPYHEIKNYLEMYGSYDKYTSSDKKSIDILDEYFTELVSKLMYMNYMNEVIIEHSGYWAFNTLALHAYIKINKVRDFLSSDLRIKDEIMRSIRQ